MKCSAITYILQIFVKIDNSPSLIMFWNLLPEKTGDEVANYIEAIDQLFISSNHEAIQTLISSILSILA